MSIFINQMLLNNLIIRISILEKKIHSYEEKINNIQDIINENNTNIETKINLIQSSISNIQDDYVKIKNPNNSTKCNDGNEIKCGKSLYNTFMKEEIEKLKLENAELSHKEIFKLAANNWKKSDKNLKNQH